ncbi:MAG: hypothetical protein VW771_10605, partial [Gammaproteobacteria bacterium]
MKSSGRHIAGEWDAHKEIEAFEQLGLVEIDQVLSFPSIEVPNLIIKRDFLDGDYEGWRHVRAYIDEEGLPLRGTRSTCSRTWRQVLAAQSGPWDQCEGMRVFRFVGSPGAKSTVDFIYSSIGGRIPAVWTHVIKDSDSTVVYRESVLSQPDQKPANVSTEGPFIEHIFGKEPYLRQTVLSEVWLDKLRRHPGLDEFCSSLIRYLHFLKESVDGQTSVNFDLIPDNLVINSDGNIGVFDHEWGVSGVDVRPETLFMRGLLYFLQRNDGDLQHIPGIRAVSKTYAGFLGYLMGRVGLSFKEEIGHLEVLERLIRQETLETYAVIDLHSSLERRWGDNTTSRVEVSVCFDESGSAAFEEHMTRHLELSSTLETTQCCGRIKFPTLGRAPTSIRFRYRWGLGAIRMDRLQVQGFRNGLQIFFTDVQGVRQLSELAVDTPEGHWLEGSPVAGDLRVYGLSLAQLGVPGEVQSIEIAAWFSWPDFAFGRVDGKVLVDRVWGKEIQLADAHREIEALRKHAGTLSDKLETTENILKLMQSSKA